jgi:hypothetical protein
MKKYKSKTAQDNWEWFLIYHGDMKCERCGYAGIAIDFHHLDPSQKANAQDTFAVKIMAGYSFRLWIKKTAYAFLCSNCHRELHAGVWEIGEIGHAIKLRESEQAKLSHLFATKQSTRLLDAILHSNTEIEQAR